MFARCADHDESEEDGEGTDVECELYSQLHHWTRRAINSKSGENTLHHAETAKDVAVSRDLCTLLTSVDRPPCVLRNSSTSCGLQKKIDLSLEVSSDLEDNNVDLEDWMLLGGAEMEGDRNIHLNLEFGRVASGSETEQQNEEAHGKDLWAVSDRDRQAPTNSLRYFAPGIFLPNFLPRAGTICSDCRKTGHLARNCPASKRRVCCILCGQQGHRQPFCPRRHCPVCGLPADTHLTGTQRPTRADLARPHRASRALPQCPLLSRCSQPCPRCGLSGHLQEACPDLWRQYHLTTQPGVPKRPGRDVRNPRPAACYNCGRRGHYGHECFQKRMSDTPAFFLPHVCHYDTDQETQECQTVTLNSIRGLLQMRAQKRTWPEKRRERREAKRLKRERAKESSLGRKGGVKDGSCSSPHRSPYKGAGKTLVPRSAPERRSGPRWTARLSDRRRKAGGRCGHNFYPPDSSFCRGKAKRRRR